MWKNRLDNVFNERNDYWLRVVYGGLCLLAVVNATAFAIVSTLKARASGTPVAITSPTAGSTLNAASPTITGTGPAGKQVYVSVDGAPQGSPVTVGSNGQWTTGIGPLAEGSHSVKAILVEGNALLNHRLDLHAGAKLDLNSKTATAFTAGLSRPSAAALDESHNRLFVNDGTPYLKVFDTQTNAAVGSVNTASSTWPQIGAVTALFYDSARGSLYVFTSFETLVVDPSTLAITNRAANPGQNLYGIAASPASGKVYVYGINSTDPLRVYDRDTHSYTQLSGLNGVAKMKFAADGSVAYFSYWGSDTVVRTLNPTTDSAGSRTFSNTSSLSDFIPGVDGTRLYTADNSATLRVFNTSTGALVSSLANVGFGPLRINPGGTKIVTTKKVFDTAAGTASGSMFAGKAFLDPTGTYTYGIMSNGADVGDSIGIYDGSGALVKNLTGVRPGPTEVTFATLSPKAYVMSPANGSFSVVDTSSQTVTATVEPGIRNTISYLTLPDGSKSYALAPGGSVVQRIDPSSGAVLANIQLPGATEYETTYEPWTINADGSSLYVLARTLPNMLSSAQVRLVKVNTATDSVTSSTLLSSSFQSWSLAVDETAGLAYAPNTTTGGIAAINLGTGVVTTYLAGALPQPGKVALSTDHSKLYVMDWAPTGHVYAVDLNSHTVTATATLQGTGRDMALSADGGSLYVTMHDNNTVKTYLWKLNAASLASQAAKELPYIGTSYPGLAVAPSGVVFAMAEENLFMFDAASLGLYSQTNLRSGAYDQPNDVLYSNQLALDLSTYYYSEDSVSFNFVPPPVSVSTTALPLAAVNYSYTAQLTSANASGSVTWTLDSGALPAGLTLGSSGSISGVPTMAGTSSFTVRATDNRSTATKQLSLTVWPNPIGFADDLLGHTDGSGHVIWDDWSPDNGGIVGLDGLDSPAGAVTDSVRHRLYVTDCSNNRVVEFDLDVTNHLLDRSADHVLGQPDLTASDPATSQAGLDCSYDTPGLAFDAARAFLFVSDPGNNRVMVFDTSTLSNGMNASYVLGQTSFTDSGYGASQTTLDTPYGLAYDDGTKYLYVADCFNDRVMAFDTHALSNGLPAVHVLGQANFSADDTSATQGTTQLPLGVALDTAGQRLFVADAYNFRVLVFSTAGLSDGQAATVELGQQDFTSRSTAGPSQSSVFPLGIAYDPGNQRLFVTDLSGNRVMVYDVAVPANNQGAAAVIGQADFTSAVHDTTQSNLNNPGHPWYESVSHQLFVPDLSNNRVMIYNLLTLGAGSLGDGQTGTPYNGSVSASHTQGTVSYALASGNLPPGLSISGSGALTGTPTSAGTFSFVVRVSDDLGAQGTMSDARSYTVTINAAPAAPPAARASAGASAPPPPTPAPSSTATPSPAEDAPVLNEDQTYVSGEGTAHELAAGQTVTFLLSEAPSAPASGDDNSSPAKHSVTVEAVGDDYCDIVVRSEPIRLRLTVGQSRDVDADRDGRADIRVKLAGISAGHARLLFSAIAAAPTVSPAASGKAAAPTKTPAVTPATSPLTLPAWLIWAGAAGLGLVILGAAVWWMRRSA